MYLLARVTLEGVEMSKSSIAVVAYPFPYGNSISRLVHGLLLPGKKRTDLSSKSGRFSNLIGGFFRACIRSMWDMNDSFERPDAEAGGRSLIRIEEHLREDLAWSRTNG